MEQLADIFSFKIPSQTAAPKVSFNVELNFTAEDIKKAQAWATRLHYRYDTLEDLMFDAFSDGIVESPNHSIF